LNGKGLEDAANSRHRYRVSSQYCRNRRCW